MAKPTKESKKGKEAAEKTETMETTEIPALKRPGTSGTENLLMTNRRTASEQFIKAQRAEKAYRAKKHATLARHNYNETKGHFSEGFKHIGLGFKGALTVVKSVPYLIGEKKEARQRNADAKKRARHLEQKKKLEEALAREAGDSEEEKEDDKEESAK